MAKFEKKLKELGLTEEKVSNGLRKKIASFRENESILDEISSRLKSPDFSEEEKEKIKEDYNSLESVLDEWDTNLVNDVIKFDRNKDKYAEMGKNLKPRQKKNATGTKQDEPAPAPAPAPQPEPEPQPEPQPKPEPQPEPQAEPQKEKSDTASWILGGLLLVLSGGLVYKFMKNK
jgi:outer membrane biosynthesis protein TonB